MSADGLSCKRCGGSDYVKSGTARGHQRYRCRGCGCNFTDTPLRGKPAAMKALAVLLYGMQHELQHDRAPAGGQQCGGAEVGARGSLCLVRTNRAG